MKKLFSVFALAGLVSMAACAGEEEEPVIIDEPVIEEPAPAPIVTPPAETMPMDTTMADTAALPPAQ